MSERFDLAGTQLNGLSLIQRKPIGDERGYLERLFCAAELRDSFGITVAQINHTLTLRSGTVRGLHFQMPPFAETKLVSCLRGKVFDVAVDLRRGSPTFLRWHSEILSGDNYKALLIPAGFAHGFQTLSDDCNMLYLHSEAYDPSAERGLNAVDPRLAIPWPIPMTDQSPRDAGHPLLTAEFGGLAV